MPVTASSVRRRALRRPGEVSPWAVLVVMWVGYFLVLNVTIVNVAPPKIAIGAACLYLAAALAVMLIPGNRR